MAHVVRYWLSVACACVALVAAPQARALDTGDIVVAAVKGEVHVTMKGVERAIRAGSVLELPATVRTGRDGAIDLKQGATSVSVGPDTLLEFPALEEPGGPIDRIVQPRGNAFYSIGKRAGRKLRVETPYLVGVVKGTQFNVAVRDEGTTISLFEGLLEIRASDESSVVDIKAGEVAARSRNDKTIGVFKMDSGKAPPPRAPRARNEGADSPVPGNDAPRGLPVSGDAGNALANDGPGRTTAAIPVVGAAVDSPPDANLSAGATGDMTAGAAVGAAAETAGVAVDVGGGATVEVNANVAPNVTAAAIEVSVDAGAGAVDVSAGTNIVVGPASVDTSVNTGVDLGGGAASVDVGASTGVNVGGAVAVDAGVGAAVDLGTNAAASVDVNNGVNAGPLSTDAGAGVAVDLGGGQGAANVDLGVNAGVGNVAAVDTGAVDVSGGANVAADVGANVAGVDAGVSAGVNAGAGAVDLGVNLGGTDVNVGVDLGLDDKSDPAQDTGNSTTPSPGNVVNDVVDTVDNVLNRLLHKPGKK